MVVAHTLSICTVQYDTFLTYVRIRSNSISLIFVIFTPQSLDGLATWGLKEKYYCFSFWGAIGAIQFLRLYCFLSSSDNL